MKKYRMTIRQTSQISVNIDAEDLEEAIMNTRKLVEGGNVKFSNLDVKMLDIIPMGVLEPLKSPATHAVIDLTTGGSEFTGTFEECEKYLDDNHDFNLALIEC